MNPLIPPSKQELQEKRQKEFINDQTDSRTNFYQILMYNLSHFFNDETFEKYWPIIIGEKTFDDLPIEDKPWRIKGRKSDYFNYGFTEESYVGYVKKLNELQQKLTSQSIGTMELPQQSKVEITKSIPMKTNTIQQSITTNTNNVVKSVPIVSNVTNTTNTVNKTNVNTTNTTSTPNVNTSNTNTIPITQNTKIENKENKPYERKERSRSRERYRSRSRDRHYGGRRSRSNSRDRYERRHRSRSNERRDRDNYRKRNYSPPRRGRGGFKRRY